MLATTLQYCCTRISRGHLNLKRRSPLTLETKSGVRTAGPIAITLGAVVLALVVRVFFKGLSLLDVR